MCFISIRFPSAHSGSEHKNNREIKYTGTDQSYPDHPDRFDVYPQVLCRESVCGRCYWEIEWSGRVFISVSYKSISGKKGVECVFGHNDQSWSLDCSPSRYSFRHNDIETDLPVTSISSRIRVNDDDDDVRRIGLYSKIYRVGVFVDESAGTLSFYSVSRNTVRHIYTVQTTFTQTLYAGFYVCSGSSVSLC
ncbi:hypothetical protein M9458_058043 [Cirrhinus mrigala]|uniref:B30.2/SPRY domain-containing protein n=1 Tax=Cirrhinus mrigala TaxID=683832 RepID=A0ABD0MEJ2_CIRMR